MYALSEGHRKLAAVWAEEYKSVLPKDIAIIAVAAEAISSNMGYVVLEYYLSNYWEVEEKNDSVF